jgi:hypothetical protein
MRRKRKTAAIPIRIRTAAMIPPMRAECDDFFGAATGVLEPDDDELAAVAEELLLL